MLLVMVVLTPTLWRSQVTTVYELLERRFGLAPAWGATSSFWGLGRTLGVA